MLIIETQSITFSHQDTKTISFSTTYSSSPIVTVSHDEMGSGFNFYVSQVTPSGCVIESSQKCSGTVYAHIMSK